MNMGTWTAIGLGIGTAMGAATNQMAIWVAAGGAAGVFIGFLTSRGRKPKAP